MLGPCSSPHRPKRALCGGANCGSIGRSHSQAASFIRSLEKIVSLRSKVAAKDSKHVDDCHRFHRSCCCAAGGLKCSVPSPMSCEHERQEGCSDQQNTTPVSCSSTILASQAMDHFHTNSEACVQFPLAGIACLARASPVRPDVLGQGQQICSIPPYLR